MIPIRGKISGVAETSSAISQLPSLLRQAGMAAMTEVLELASTTVRTRFLRGPYPENIERRSGGFAATFVRGHRLNIFEVKAQGTNILGAVGSKDIRGRVLDEGTGYLPGGVIKPKRGRFLAIPSDEAVTPTGQLKSRYAAAKTSWRNVPNIFVGGTGIRRGGEGLYLAERVGRGRIRVVAWLVRSVYIKGRGFMGKTRDAIRPQVPVIFQTRFDRILERMNATLSRIRG